MPPFVVTVDDKRRIRLPDKIEQDLSWVSKKGEPAIKCRIYKGAFGGIQIAPETSDLGKQCAAFLENMSPIPTAAQSNAKWMRLRSFFKATWPVTLGSDTSHYRCTLPAAISDIGWVNLDPDSELVGMVDGEVLTLWDKMEFAKFQTETAQARSVLFAEQAKK